MGWDACTMEPDIWLRWLECHLAASTIVAGLLSAAAVGLAAMAPVFYDARKERSRIERAMLSAMIIVQIAKQCTEIFRLSLQSEEKLRRYLLAGGAIGLRNTLVDMQDVVGKADLPLILTARADDIRTGLATIDAYSQSAIHAITDGKILPHPEKEDLALAIKGILEACDMFSEQTRLRVGRATVQNMM